MHSKGFVICALSQDMFHFDGASRTLFLSDLSTVRREPPKELSHLARWTGALHYKPSAWDEDESIKRNLELGAVFYMCLEFALGSLPWDSLSLDKCESKMANFANVDGVPKEMKGLEEP